MPWDFDANRPIYTQLTERLRLRIASGEYPPGGKLPAVRELAAEAGANPNTVQRAFADLEREGLIYTQRTSGRFVTEDPAAIDTARKALAEEKIDVYLGGMRSLGYTAGGGRAGGRGRQNKKRGGMTHAYFAMSGPDKILRRCAGAGSRRHCH